jgi:hypothetical protein
MRESPDVLFKFSQPSGAPAITPSPSLTAALHKLSESNEMRSLMTEAQAQGRTVVVQVYHSSDGRPFLIHLKAVSGKLA